jgi:hypothetical protein
MPGLTTFVVTERRKLQWLVAVGRGLTVVFESLDALFSFFSLPFSFFPFFPEAFVFFSLSLFCPVLQRVLSCYFRSFVLLVLYGTK